MMTKITKHFILLLFSKNVPILGTITWLKKDQKIWAWVTPQLILVANGVSVKFSHWEEFFPIEYM